MILFRRSGITIIELLVVLAILGILLQLILPAIQGSREASRRTHCENNLRQLGLGVMTHHDTIGHYPTSGWGPSWIGDWERGRGRNQPGSWIFCVLDFIEQGNLWQSVKGQTG